MRLGSSATWRSARRCTSAIGGSPAGLLARAGGAGEAARSVRALAADADVGVAATAAGVFERAQGGAPGPWLRVSGLPFGEASRVALVRGEGGLEVWAAIEGALWTASEEQGARRVSLPGAAQGETGPIDLVATHSGELIALLHRSLAVRSAAGEWRVERLVLPPGAQPLRIAVEPGGRLWLATDVGLLVAEDPAGPWQRTGPPAGGTAVAALAGERGELVVATAQGLLRHDPVSSEIAAAAPPAPLDPPARASRAPDPPIAEVQRRALRYVALDPSRMEQLWDGAGRRAWAPQVSVRGDWGRDLDRGYGFDETFSSGETHWLYDRDRSRAQAYAVGVALSWDLGDAVFNLDRIDVSREARLVTQLRDDVLDEVNQLYFERQRVLASLASPPPDTPAELLALRADELASNLDAWTGGWFSEQVAKSSRGPALPEQDSKP